MKGIRCGFVETGLPPQTRISLLWTYVSLDIVRDPVLHRHLEGAGIRAVVRADPVHNAYLFRRHRCHCSLPRSVSYLCCAEYSALGRRSRRAVGFTVTLAPSP